MTYLRMTNKNKRVPQRSCVICRVKSDKDSLIRVVKSPEGNAVIDIMKKLPGRGAYICPDAECISMLGALATCVFCSWPCGWGWPGFRDEAGAGAGLAPPRAWAPYMRWLLPAVLLGIIFGGVRG